MTRSGRSARSRELADLFAGDPEAAILGVLQDAGSSLGRGAIIAELRDAGVAEIDAIRAWKRLQPAVSAHTQVVVEDNGYRWAPNARRLTAEEALHALARGRLTATVRAQLADTVTAAITAPSASKEADARDRQAQIDGVRALAELAIEVEELTANEASSRAMVHRVRARVKRAGLEPIESAGERTRFDRKRHKPIGEPIGDGASVIVVRPGYLWQSTADAVEIAKAVVQQAD